jgi:hypothetical protein
MLIMTTAVIDINFKSLHMLSTVKYDRTYLLPLIYSTEIVMMNFLLNMRPLPISIGHDDCQFTKQGAGSIIVSHVGSDILELTCTIY